MRRPPPEDEHERGWMVDADEAAALLNDPSHAVDVPRALIPRLLIRLAALQSGLVARLAGQEEAPPPHAAATLTLHETAVLLRKSTSWVRRAVRRGELPFARRVGRSLVFLEEDIRRYLDARRPCYEPPPKPTTGGGAHDAKFRASEPTRRSRGSARNGTGPDWRRSSTSKERTP